MKEKAVLKTVGALNYTLAAIERQKKVLLEKIAKHDEHIEFIRGLHVRIDERLWFTAKRIRFQRGCYYVMHRKGDSGEGGYKVALYYCWLRKGKKYSDGTQRKSTLYLALKMGQDAKLDYQLDDVKKEFEVWALPEDIVKPMDAPCPHCGRNTDGKWFAPCPAHDCPSNMCSSDDNGTNSDDNQQETEVDDGKQ